MEDLNSLRKLRKKKNIQTELKKKIKDKKRIIKTSYDIQTGDYINYYKSKNRDYKRIVKKFISVIKKEFNDVKTVFDFGTGEMTTFYEIFKNLKKNKVYFVNDVSLSRLYAGKNFIKRKIKNHIKKINFFTCPHTNIPFKDNSIDLVLTCHSLEPNNFCKKLLINELYRIAKKGVCMMEPHYEIANNKQQIRMRKFGYIRGIEKYFLKNKYNYKIIKNENFFNKDNPSSIFIIKKKVKKVSSYGYVDPFTKEKLIKIKKNFYNKRTKQLFLEFNDINLFDNENKKLIVC